MEDLVRDRDAACRRRGGAAAALVILLAACGPTAAPSTTPLGTSGSTAAPGPTLRPSPSVLLPSPTAADCLAFDLTKQSQPNVLLAPVDNPERVGAYGLNGSGQVGDQSTDAGPWHQPAPGAALEVPRSASLVLTATLDERGVMPTCLGSVELDAAPFSATAIAPGADAMTKLASKPTVDPVSAFRFGAPASAGEWVVRATITFPTTPGPSRIESFFRLRVDTPAAAVGGKASRSDSCGTPGALPPTAYLAVAGGTPVAAQRGSGDWRNTSADGPPPPGSDAEAARGDTLIVSIQDDVCAGWWAADLAPVQPIEWIGREPFLDLIAAHTQGEAVPPIRVNRLRLAVIPPGDWWVGVFLEFEDGHDQIGSTSNYWHVVVR